MLLDKRVTTSLWSVGKGAGGASGGRKEVITRLNALFAAERARNPHIPLPADLKTETGKHCLRVVFTASGKSRQPRGGGDAVEGIVCNEEENLIEIDVGFLSEVGKRVT